MKKTVSLILAVILGVSMFAACSSGDAGTTGNSSSASTQEPGSEGASTADSSSVSEEPVTSEQSAQPVPTQPSGGAPAVYMTTDISPAGLMAVYEALGREAAGNNVAVKISTGEPGGNHYLSPDLIKDFVQAVDGTII